MLDPEKVALDPEAFVLDPETFALDPETFALDPKTLRWILGLCFSVATLLRSYFPPPS